MKCKLCGSEEGTDEECLACAKVRAQQNKPSKCLKDARCTRPFNHRGRCNNVPLNRPAVRRTLPPVEGNADQRPMTLPMEMPLSSMRRTTIVIGNDSVTITVEPIGDI
jgi:hypothetical protein